MVNAKNWQNKNFEKSKMGRVCAVKNCNSGSAADMKRRRELNLKKPTFFKVPKVSLSI